MSLHLVTGYAGKEHVTSSDHGSFNIAFVGAGEYVFNRADKFACTILDESTVRIASGDIMMQGRHIRQIENTQTTITVDAGVAGLYRKDMIVVEYKKDNTTKIETAHFRVIKGTNAETAAQAELPAYTHGDITEESSDLINQMPLYELDFEGIEIVRAVPLFTILYDYNHALDEIESNATIFLQGLTAEANVILSEVTAALEHEFENANTVFNNDGSITTTYDTRIKTTVFNANGSITETLRNRTNNQIYATKTTVFNVDGSITETVQYME